MSVAATDIKFYLTGGASNSNVNASLGGTTSSVEITTAVLNNLFDNISAAEALVDHSVNPLDFRAIAVKNTHASDTLFSAVIYGGYGQGSSYTALHLALDSGTQSVADESTAPSSPTLSFDAYGDAVDSLSLGNITAGAQKRIWIRRMQNANVPATSGDQETLTVKGQTT